MPDSSVPWLAIGADGAGSSVDEEFCSYANDGEDTVDTVWCIGEGITFGLIPNKMAEPVRPTAAERRNPGLERSMRYHRKGLTRARVRETWRVDAQGSFLCFEIKVSVSCHEIELRARRCLQ
jgi:hypothetical protein